MSGPIESEVHTKGLWLEPTTDLSLQPRYRDPCCQCIRRCHGRLDLYGRSIRLIPVGSLVLDRQAFLLDLED